MRWCHRILIIGRHISTRRSSCQIRVSSWYTMFIKWHSYSIFIILFSIGIRSPTQSIFRQQEIWFRWTHPHYIGSSGCLWFGKDSCYIFILTYVLWHSGSYTPIFSTRTCLEVSRKSWILITIHVWIQRRSHTNIIPSFQNIQRTFISRYRSNMLKFC